MKTMQAISMPRPRRLWIALPLVVSTLVVVVLFPVSAHAAPEPPAVPAAKALREVRSGDNPWVRGYNNHWEYGPGPMMSRPIGVGDRGAPRWLVGLLIVLAAALVAAMAWSLLRNRTRGAPEGGAQQILERRLAEGAIGVEEFEQRRDALRGDNRNPS
jgi:uncharacterized membrane protein